MSYLKSIGTVFIYIGLFLAVITFMPGLPPYIEFKEISSLVQPDLLKIDLKNRLTGAQKLFEGEINCPESFSSYNDQLYSGVHGGYVVRIEEDRFVPVVKFGEKCDGIWQEHKCGRPLGLQFDTKGNLYVVDTYYGIFKVNVATGEYKNIVNISKPIDGEVPRLPNSIDIAKNGDLYWSDSSSDFALYDGILTFLSNPSGRLMRYNEAKKKNEILVRNLGFANGVLLSDDESFVLVAETQTSRIIKYNLKGSKAGQQEIFVEGLPGGPDNIHSDGDGGFLVSMILLVTPENPQIWFTILPHPYLRKMIVRLLMLMELPFKLLHDIYPNIYTEKIMHAIGSFNFGLHFMSINKSIVLRIDAYGNIIEALFSDDDTINSISSSYIHNGYLWFGSPWNRYLARIPLKQAFPDLVDIENQSSRTRNEKQLSNAAASDVKSERAKRDTASTTAKPVESKSKKVSTQTIPKPTVAPTTPKPTPKPTPAPTTTSKPTTSKSTVAPVIPKPTAAPKPSPVLKADKPAATGNNAKPSETKPISKSVNAEIKKDNAKTVNDAKLNTKLNSPHAKLETNSKAREDATKKTSTKSEKNVKMEQDASVKQKVQPEKIKSVETNRPRDDF